MIPSIQTFQPEIARALLGVFFDIDDTLTTRGKIGSDAYQALWAVTESGLKAVAIKGRPVRWCDHIARMWPLWIKAQSTKSMRFSRNMGQRLRCPPSMSTAGLEATTNWV
jgi:hypothetical protein